MIQMVSDEESKRWQAEMEGLYRSGCLEDRVVAILMDLKIGNRGDSGDGARAKAKAICSLVSEKKDPDGPLKPGEARRLVIPDSFDGIRFEVGRMVKMVEEARKDPLVITTARRIAALSITSRKPKNNEERNLLILKGIHRWCKENFVYVDDPVGVELIQTPNRMLRELEIPPQLHMLMWKPIAKAVGGKLPRPMMTGDSDESSILGLSLAAAVGIYPLRVCLGGNGGALHYAWGAAQINGKWRNIDILSPKFDTHPPFDDLEHVDIQL